MGALAAGAGIALVVDTAVARLVPQRRTAAAALGLVAAAAVYPVSRRRLGMDARETVTLAAAGAVAAIAVRLPTGTARRLLGVGWAAHAMYDAVFTHDASITRLPAWYAPLCAGADIAMGARLILA
jgi:hypothetical protein